MIIFVINLDRAVERWRAIRSQIDRLQLPPGVPVVRVSAVDGEKGISWDDVSLRSRLRIQKRQTSSEHWPIDSAPAVACTLSHMKCWDLLLQQYPEHESAIILEDDALFNTKLPNLSADILNLPRYWMSGYDLLLLGIGWLPHGAPQPRRTTYNPGVCTIHDFVGSHGYCLTPRAAATLLQHALPVEQHVDFYLGNVAQLGLLSIGVMCPEFVKVNHDVPLYIPHQAFALNHTNRVSFGIILVLMVLVVALALFVVHLLWRGTHPSGYTRLAQR